MPSARLVDVLRSFRRLLTGRRGNSTILLALSALPVFAGLSLSIDYGLARAARGRLDTAAISAASQATSAAAEAFLAGANDAMEVGIAAARARFIAQTASQEAVTINPVQVALSQSGGLFNATVSYTGAMPTSIARLVGVSTLPLSGQASASFSYSPPVDLQLLVSTSSSMTWPATPAERVKLERLIAGLKPAPTLPGHLVKAASNAGPDEYEFALKNHIVSRITAVQDAVSRMVRMMNTLDVENRLQLGLYTYDQGLNPIHPLSHDLNSVLRAVPALVPTMSACNAHCADTSLGRALQTLAAADAALPQGAEGTPQRYLFVVTDGLQDEDDAPQPSVRAIKGTDCDGMKALGFTIMILHLPYPYLPNNVVYNRVGEPMADQVKIGLQACASSPNYVFEATDPAEISVKLQNMLRLALRTASHP
jgi:hypothetical protein